MSNQPIGVLDSGVGGLTIWKEIVQELPRESTIYIADSKNCPYGVKPTEEIYNLSRRLVQFLVKREVKLIVLACNTITVSCLGRLRGEFSSIPIIGTVPVVKTAARLTKNGRIGVLSTSKTAESEYQKNLIAKFAKDCKVVNIGADELVSLIEKGAVNTSMIRIIKAILQPFRDAGVDIIALGCSHFPFVKKQIQQVLGSNVTILDSGAAIARQVKRILEQRNELSKGQKPKHQFFTTGSRLSFQFALKSLIGYNSKDKVVGVEKVKRPLK